MIHAFLRSEMLLGREALARVTSSKVAVFGIGGVGGYTVEALARTGLKSFVLVDRDCIDITNINRQIHAVYSTVGQPKVEVMKQRILDINPEARVEVHRAFYSSESAPRLLARDYDYVVDAIDTISSKIDMVTRCVEMNIPIISSMGAGNKLDPTAFRVSDIYSTSVDPIARVMRYELRKRGVERLKVVYSTEKPVKPQLDGGHNTNETAKASGRRSTPGSVSFIPSVVGLIMAGEVIKDLIKNHKDGPDI